MIEIPVPRYYQEDDRLPIEMTPFTEPVDKPVKGKKKGGKKGGKKGKKKKKGDDEEEKKPDMPLDEKT